MLKIPYFKIQTFCDRSFTWFLNYCLAKFLEILMIGSFEISKYLQNHSVSIFRTTAHARCIKLGSFDNKKNSENGLVPCIITFSYLFVTYLCNKGLKQSTYCVQSWRKIAKIEQALSKLNDHCIKDVFVFVILVHAQKLCPVTLIVKLYFWMPWHLKSIKKCTQTVWGNPCSPINIWDLI